MEELKIIYLSPDELTPYEGNTRKHSPEDIEQIKEAIKADGFNDPIGPFLYGRLSINLCRSKAGMQGRLVLLVYGNNY